MLTAGLHTADSFSQLITVLLAFVFVLALTLWTTRWIAKYQKGQKAGQNIDVVETCPMAMENTYRLSDWQISMLRLPYARIT